MVLHELQICLVVGFILFFKSIFFLGTQLEMEDGDEIDAMLHQTGGGNVYP